MSGMNRAQSLLRRTPFRMRLVSRSLAFVLPLLLLIIFSGTALANTCVAVGAFTCAQGNHDGAFIGGSGTAMGDAGLLLTGNMFTVGDHNGTGGADVIIFGAVLGAAGPTGTLNGISFTSLSSLPSNYLGAIAANLQAAGFCNGSACNKNNLSFGYVDLGVGLPAGKGSTITVTASGVGAGTVLYAEIVGANGQIIVTTSNSSSAVTGNTSTVPEPGTISLMITGLCGIAGGAWRKLRG